MGNRISLLALPPGALRPPKELCQGDKPDLFEDLEGPGSMLVKLGFEGLTGRGITQLQCPPVIVLAGYQFFSPWVVGAPRMLGEWSEQPGGGGGHVRCSGQQLFTKQHDRISVF